MKKAAPPAKKKRKNRPMRKLASPSVLIALFLALMCGLALAQKKPTTKTLQGRVFGSGDTPLSGAIVYLEDSKTNDIRSFISTDDGSFRFGQLSLDTDYQVWARYKTAKSPTRTVSSYDSRTEVTIDLHIKTK
jgi:hypothetical protein